VNINDTGVDATHPDLSSRVIGDQAGSLTDHLTVTGTHVAGIIASSGGAIDYGDECFGINYAGVAGTVSRRCAGGETFLNVNRSDIRAGLG